jgi:putative MFS transporter
VTENQDAKLSAYQKGLFLFLSVASFFEGYDFIALTQILPNLRADLGIDRDAAGLLVTVINVGTVIAYVLVRRADRWGRRRVLTITIAGYTLFTFLSGLAPNVYAFALFQMVARIFLIGEWAISMVIAAEEFPDARRGMVIGVVSAFSSLGAIVCAGLVPILIQSPFGWRTVYFVGIAPLIVLAYARRGLKETRRFTEQAGRRAASSSSSSLFAIWKTPHRRRVIELGTIWFFSYIASQNGVTFWKDFAVTERGFTDAQVGTAIVVAALGSMPLVFMVGRLIDVVGRRRGAAIVFSAGALGTYASYTLHGVWPLTAALVLGIFSASAYLPVLNAFTTELFPTERRAEGFAWANNLIGRMGYVLSPLAIGVFAQELGWGPVIRATSVFPLVTIALVFWLLPETKSRSLEETARV